MRIANTVILFVLALALPIDAGREEYEQDLVTSVLTQSGIPGLVKHYQSLLGEIGKNSYAGSAALKRFMTGVERKTRLPIDTYMAHWTWHPTFEECKQEHEDTMSDLRDTLNSGTSMTEESLERIISQGRCQTWASMPEQLLSIIIELLQGYRREDNPNWDLTSLDAIIENVGSTVPSLVSEHP